MTLTKTSLARQALEQSVEVREEAGYDDRVPVCIYEVGTHLLPVGSKAESDALEQVADLAQGRFFAAKRLVGRPSSFDR